MNDTDHFGDVQVRRFAGGQIVVALLCAVFVPSLLAQEPEATGSATNGVSAAVSETATGTAANSPNTKTEGNPQSARNLSSGVQDILKMADAGVSMDVIKTFVEHSPGTYDPTPEDLIALKEHKVPDEVTSALLNRRAAVKKQTERIRSDVAAPTIVRRLSKGRYLEPDSYDFWYYHYAYPRALSYSYKTLSPYDPRYRFYGWHGRYGHPVW